MKEYKLFLSILILVFVYSIQICIYDYYWANILCWPLYCVLSVILIMLSNLCLNNSIYFVGVLSNFGQYFFFLKKSKGMIVHYFYKCSIEELIWRVIPNWLLFNNIDFSIHFNVILNFAFTFMHYVNWEQKRIEKFIEMLLFFTFSSYLYYYLNDYFLILIIHLNRNLTIRYLSYIKEKLSEN